RSIRKPIPVAEAVERVLAHAEQTGTETVPLEESAGRILAEPVTASHPVPPFNRSPYDGFAVHSEDTEGASGSNRIQFTVIDDIRPGSVSNQTLGERQAARIMTGAPLPDGADVIVMFEQTVEDGDTFTIRKPFEPLENVSL